MFNLSIVPAMCTGSHFPMHFSPSWNPAPRDQQETSSILT